MTGREIWTKVFGIPTLMSGPERTIQDVGALGL